MAGIRVSTSVKKIEVNDQGDCITLNFSDNSFPDRFFAMLDSIQQRAEDVQVWENEMQERGGAEPRAAAALYRQFHEDIMGEVDNLFGPDTCRKVFGEIVPGIELFDEFFTQLLPFFEAYGRERAEKLSRYSAGRTANV